MAEAEEGWPAMAAAGTETVEPEAPVSQAWSQEHLDGALQEQAQVAEAGGTRKRPLEDGSREEEGKEEGRRESKPWPNWPGENIFRLLVPMRRVGAIIGRKGAWVKSTCEETRARIKVVDGIPGTDERVVLITGREDWGLEQPPAVLAMLRVYQRSVDGDNEENDERKGIRREGGRPDASGVLCRMLVPGHQAGSLIGKGGSTIRQLQDSSGSMIRILSPNEETSPYALPDDRILTFEGSQGSVYKGLASALGHLRRFLHDRSVVSVFESLPRTALAVSGLGMGVDGLGAGAAVGGAYSRRPEPLMGGGGVGNGSAYFEPYDDVDYLRGPSGGAVSRSGGQDMSFLSPRSMRDRQDRMGGMVGMGTSTVGGGLRGLGASEPLGRLQGSSQYGRQDEGLAPSRSMGGGTGLVSPAVKAIGQVIQRMTVPVTYADSIIGVSGSHIAYIRRTSGASVTVHTTDGSEMAVEMRGSAAQVQAAQQLVQDFMAGMAPINGGGGSSQPSSTSYAGLESGGLGGGGYAMGSSAGGGGGYDLGSKAYGSSSGGYGGQEYLGGPSGGVGGYDRAGGYSLGLGNSTGGAGSQYGGGY